MKAKRDHSPDASPLPFVVLKTERETIFGLLGRVGQTLAQEKGPEAAEEFFQRALQCSSEEKVRQVMSEYVTLLSPPQKQGKGHDTFEK